MNVKRNRSCWRYCIEESPHYHCLHSNKTTNNKRLKEHGQQCLNENSIRPRQHFQAPRCNRRYTSDTNGRVASLRQSLVRKSKISYLLKGIDFSWTFCRFPKRTASSTGGTTFARFRLLLWNQRFKVWNQRLIPAVLSFYRVEQFEFKWSSLGY